MMEPQSHILVADDEPYSLFMLKELLDEQFVVHTAHDGAWALEFLRSGGRVEVLRESGCHLLQGFLFSRPLPAAEIAAHWLAPAAPDFPRFEVSGSEGACTDV